MTIGAPPRGLPPDLHRWLEKLADEHNEMLRRQERPSRAPWSLANVTELRTIDGGTGSAGDVLQALTTLIRDLINANILPTGRA